MATISENLQTIINIKADIKTAIENKGVTVGDASFSEYAGKIDSIEAGGSGSDIITLPNNFKIAYSGYNYSSDWSWPANIKFPQQHDWNHAFAYVKHVTNLPAISTTRPTDIFTRTDFSYMFYNASFIPSYNKEFFDSLDYSNVDTTSYMFYNASIMLDDLYIDSPFLTAMDRMFQNWEYSGMDYTSLPAIVFTDLSNVTTVANAFSVKKKSTGELPAVSTLRLPNLGLGFINNGSSYHDLNLLNLLFTREQVLTIFNDLGTVSVTDAKVRFATDVKALLTDDDIAIATSKGWTVKGT